MQCCRARGVLAGVHAGLAKLRVLALAVPGPAVEKIFTLLANKLCSCVSIY